MFELKCFGQMREKKGLSVCTASFYHTNQTEIQSVFVQSQFYYNAQKCNKPGTVSKFCTQIRTTACGLYTNCYYHSITHNTV